MEQTLHPHERKLLEAFDKFRSQNHREKADFSLSEKDVCNLSGMQGDQIRKAASWLLPREFIDIEEESGSVVSLTDIGKKYAEIKMPELRIIDIVEKEGEISISSLYKSKNLEEEEVRKAIGALKQQGKITIKDGIVRRTDEPITDVEELQAFLEELKRQGVIPLNRVSPEQRKNIESMHRKRGKAKRIFRVNEQKYRFYRLTERGTEALKELLKETKKTGVKGEAVLTEKEMSQLTPEFLKDGRWKEISLRKYNIGLKPKRIVGGGKHPYARFLDFVRSKFIAMGFVEMTGSLVENEFWNMDALYMPQFHSARDIHDIYFVKEPKYSKEIDKKLLDNVARTHSTGGDTPSRGWGYNFDKNRARRLILRSQGTPLSVRTLASNPQIPGKYFAMARCFRYDKIDVTHFPDFFQIEGIVLSKDINFKTLLGLLELFAKEFAGSSEMKFAPCYFPFTEPSVELDVWDEKMGWVELGGAGIFRREVTYPFDIKVPVIAWGLGLSRMAMLTLDIQDIRDLFAPDLEFIREKRVCRQSQ